MSRGDRCVLVPRRKEPLTLRQTLDSLRLDLSVDEEDPLETEPLAVV